MRQPSKAVMKAIKLLKKKNKTAALNAIGKHKANDCPIAAVYGISASVPWGTEVSPNDKEVMKKAGWTRMEYNSFIEWYDLDGEERYEFLKQELKK